MEIFRHIKFCRFVACFVIRTVQLLCYSQFIVTHRILASGPHNERTPEAQQEAPWVNSAKCSYFNVPLFVIITFYCTVHTVRSCL